MERIEENRKITLKEKAKRKEKPKIPLMVLMVIDSLEAERNAF